MAANTTHRAMSVSARRPSTASARAAREDFDYQRHILQGVSRTFALTIPELPEPLRTAVGNAYLLCRIADTIEDTTALDLEEKRRYSEAFVRLVQGIGDIAALRDDLAGRIANGATPAEQDLIRNCHMALRITHSLSEAQREAMARCVEIMAQGMVKFQRIQQEGGLREMSELDDYCYYVAGVVGEMLTDLFCDYSPQIACHRSDLRPLAVSFGQGLQMTNILKDVWADKDRNMCWLPACLFAGRDAGELGADAAFEDAMPRLVSLAAAHLENALRYVLFIPKSEAGIRRFCLYALGMALLTLRKIHRNPRFTRGDTVKISRRSVHATVLVVRLICRSNTLLKLAFNIAARGLPQPATPFAVSIPTSAAK